MFNNIGKKIKAVAKTYFYIIAIASAIAGLVLMGWQDEFLFTIGLAILVGGPLVAWLSSLTLYGFGELIDKTCDIERNTRGGAVKSDVQAKADNEKTEKLEKLRAQGLITEQEYSQALEK